MSKKAIDAEQLQEEILKLSAATEELGASKKQLIEENLKIQEENLNLQAQLDDLKKKQVAPGPPKSAISSKPDSKAVKLSGKAVKVNYTLEGDATAAKFKLKVPTVFFKGKIYNEAEALANPELMTYLVENTFKRGESKFVQEHFEK